MKIAIALICLLALAYIVLKSRSDGKRAAGSSKKLKAPAKKTPKQGKTSAKGTPGSRQQATLNSRQPQSAAQHPYRATVIVCTSSACEAARELAGKPFLVAERNTPELPLPGCDAKTCECKYQHRNDRRVEDSDRRYRSSLSDSVYLSKGDGERRGGGKRGRRADD